MSSKMVLDLSNLLASMLFNLNLNLDNHSGQVFSRFGCGFMFIDITDEFLNAYLFF